MLVMKMPRGKTARTRKRMAKAEQEGISTALTNEEAKVWTKSKNAMVWVKQILEKHIDKVPKLLAILGMTYLVKRAIDTSEELTAKAVKVVTGGEPSEIMKLFSWLPIFGPAVGVGAAIAGFFVPSWIGEPTAKIVEEIPSRLDVEGMEWLLAFTMAYMIVEHGGEIALGFGDIAKSLTGMVGLLLG